MERIELDSKTGQGKLNILTWECEGAPKAILHIVHGMAEHISRYDEFARYFAAKGIFVVGADTASHGGSRTADGVKGYFGEENGWSNLIEDIEGLRAEVRKLYPDKPYVLFGHSMGSFLVRSYAARYGERVDAFVFCGTAGKNPAVPIAKLIAKSEIKKLGSKAPSTKLNSLSFGSYNKAFRPNRTEFDWLSVNNANVDKYIADSECGYPFTAAGFRDLFDGLSEIGSSSWAARVPNKPILVIAGANDPVGANGKGPREVASKLTATGHNVILKIYDGMRHEIHNEDERERVYRDILTFITMAV